MVNLIYLSENNAKIWTEFIQTFDGEIHVFSRVFKKFKHMIFKGFRVYPKIQVFQRFSENKKNDNIIAVNAYS